MKSRSFSERTIVQAIVTIYALLSVALSPFLAWNPNYPFEARILAILGSLLCLIIAVAYWRGFERAPEYCVLISSVLIVILLPEPYLSARFSLLVLMPPILALIVAPPLWIVGSSITIYLGLLFRADWQGVYREPVGLVLFTTAVSGMYLARKLTDMARQQAEEQSRLLEEERAKLAERVAERTYELEQANLELRLANQMKDSFLASVSHELRTPLNVILGNIELIDEGIYGPVTQRQRGALRTADASGRHLLNLINDILDLARIEAGHFELNFVEVPVGDICEQCLLIVREQAERKNLRLESKIVFEPGFIEGDPRRLHQILHNLLDNAVKFTPAGGAIGLTVDHDTSRQMIQFTVWDTGIGIAPADQEQIFKPFIQVDRSLARNYEGTGLGLALVKQLVSHHGGDVVVESTPGTGSRFIVRLPIEQHLQVAMVR